MIYEPITILSAELSHLDFHANFDRTCELRSAIIDMGLSFVGVTTVAYNNKTQSFIVTTPTHKDLLKLAKKFGQDSILISDQTRETVQVFTDNGKAISKGKLYPSSKNDALKQISYMFFVEDGKEHYFITGEKNVAAN